MLPKFFVILNKRINSQGAIATLVVGFLLGLFRLVIDTPVALTPGFSYAEGSFLWIINNIFFQYYSVLILIVCALVIIAVSYATAPPSMSQIAGLTTATVTAEQKAEVKSSYTRGDVIASGIVLILIVLAYLYFNG